METKYVLPSDVILPPSERVSRAIELVSPPEKLNFSKLFGNDHPVELEIGFGKGLFLMGSGYAHPDINYIGIEYARKYFVKACDRIEKRPISNVRLVHGEAFFFLSEYIPDASLSKIHLYFPDPWPKSRHHKRRLFQTSFIELVYRKLTDGGFLYIATDHQGYWEWMDERLQSQRLLRKTERLPQPPLSDSFGLTNYEIKYEKEGRNIHRVVYQK
ncbi:MAG: tRNA (guanosine(46)-N7)-methyltransferase TrmB [Acidobacteria bacterium]|nr:MAG: tRNA (guanosine(46)-N7)-methyltransferase TrmB [Acidobacteriota bacterium]